MKCDSKKAKKLYEDFWNGNTALKGCKEALEKAYKSRGGKGKGFIKGLDGRKLFPRSLHSIVNLKFQSDGALIVKKAMTILFLHWLPKTDIDVRILLSMHDEWQAQVKIGDEERYKELALKALVEAGKYFNYNVPIEGDARIGRNWAQCH